MLSSLEAFLDRALSKRCVRRSGRLPLSTRLIITPAESQSKFRADSQTIDVSLHGARIHTDINLETDMRIRVFQPWRNRIQDGRVIWARVTGIQEYGIELADPEDFWGINFPPDRWHELDFRNRAEAQGSGSSDIGLTATTTNPVSGSAVSADSAVRHAGAADVTRLLGRDAVLHAALHHDGKKTFSLEIPESGLTVVVDGITFVGLGFRETGLLLPHESAPNTAYLLLRSVIRDGARLRVTFPNHFVTTVHVRSTHSTQSLTRESLVLIELPDGFYLSGSEIL